MQKLLSDQTWSLVLKLNLLWRSGIQYHKLGTFFKPWSRVGSASFFGSFVILLNPLCLHLSYYMKSLLNNLLNRLESLRAVKFYMMCEWNWVPLKLSSLTVFVINLSTQNFIPFLEPPLLPSELKSIKEKRGLKPSRTTWGFPGYKNLSVSPVSW